jgi:integrase
MNSVIVVQNYDDSKKEKYRAFLSNIGSDIDFDSDSWKCDKLVRIASEYSSSYNLVFDVIPNKYKEMVKYFSVIRMLNGKSPKGIKGHVYDLGIFFKVIEEVEYKKFQLAKCTQRTAMMYKEYLDGEYTSMASKSGKWSSVNVFFRTMQGFDSEDYKNPFVDNPYSHYKRYDNKYIPKEITQKIDVAFKDENIDLRFRCIYWILRLIPSRISEVVGMKIDCLKSFNGAYQLFIPTWKQNGGHREPIIRTIRLEYEGMAAYLIDLIKGQQAYSRSIQKHMKINEKDLLFSYQEYVRYDENRCFFKNHYRTTKGTPVNTFFKIICKEKNINGINGETFQLSTHMLRHNGITDRLIQGFTIPQVAEMTGHHGSKMIYESYTHMDLNPEVILDKQNDVLGESNDDGRYIVFNGRILNMEEALEKKLLRNVRAHRVNGGICTDITGCKSDMFNCLDCKHFAPDHENLEYFKGQVISWEKKIIQFEKLPMVSQNARKNANLFQGVVDKITDGIGGVSNE